MFGGATSFNQDLCDWDTTMLLQGWVEWNIAGMFDFSGCPETTPGSNMCHVCTRRDRHLRFLLPESSTTNNYDNERNHEQERHEEGGRNERKNHHHEEEHRRALQEEGDVIPPSLFDVEVGVIKATDGPVTGGGPSPCLGFIGTVLGLVVGAVLLA